MTNDRLSKVENYVRGPLKPEGDDGGPTADRLWTQLVDKTAAALTLEPGDTLVLRVSPEYDAETVNEFAHAARQFEAESGIHVLVIAADDMAAIRAEKPYGGRGI